MTPDMWLKKMFNTHNAFFFDNALDVPVLKLARLADPNMGCVATKNDKLVLYLHSDLFLEWSRGKHRLVADVLVHEMAHLHLLQQGIEHTHDSDEWTTELKRLLPMLGLPVQTLSALEREQFPWGNTRADWYTGQAKRRYPGRTLLAGYDPRKNRLPQWMIDKQVNALQAEWDEGRQ